MIPEKVSVTATLSVIKTGPQHMSAIASVKEVTCYVKAGQKLIGLPSLQGERGPMGPVGNAVWGGITGNINDQTDLGYMAQVDDAPSDNAEYVRKNGAWAVSSGGGGGGGASWGAITGTLSNQTDLQTALGAKADTADLGDLAYEDSVDYSDVTNTPTLGTMASVNDASSDNKTYGRKNGNWVEVTGGGGGSVDWGDIGGTLSDQTDLQTALDSKTDLSNITSNFFDETQTYYAGEFVIYNGYLWRFFATHQAGPWAGFTDADRTSVTGELYEKADVRSPLFLGTPKAPTPTAGDSSSNIATTAFVQGEISGKHLHISMASTSSLGTISNAAITTTMRVVNIVWGTPANVTSNVTWNTNTAGQLVLSGTLAGATSAEIDLIDFG